MRTLDIGLVCQNVVRRDGQGRVMLELARTLADRGHRVTVYAHRLDETLAGRVAFRRIPRPPGPQLIDDVVFLVLATVAVRRAAHDVVCVLGPTALPRAPFVYNAQFSHRGWRRTWTRATRPSLYHRAHALLIAALETLCARRAGRIISSTAALARDVLPGAERKTVVVPDGVDLSQFAPPTVEERAAARHRFGLGDGDLAIGFFGGWATPRKGLDPLLHALAASADGERLLLAADGARGSLQERVRRLGVDERVIVAGFEPPQRVLAACDLVAVPSLYEPFSLVALESAACGVPVVLAASAGAAPLLEGAAVAVADPADPVQLLEAIGRLRDPDERERRAAAGRAAAERLTWRIVFERAADAIEVMAPSPAGSPARLRTLSPAELRHAASVDSQEALRLWNHALGRGGRAAALVSLLEDWSEWSGISYPDMLQTILEAQEKVNREWEEQGPQGPDEVAAFYDATNTLIPLLLWWHGTTPRPARCAAVAAAVIEAAGGRRVLDFGCGIGSTSLLLASRGLEPVLSDVARDTMRFAEWRLRQRGLDPSTVDLLSRRLADLPSRSVDGIVAFAVFEHLPNLTETLDELDRLLEPGGVLCFDQIFIPEERDEPQHYPLRGEALLWFHRRGYRLTHVIDVCWVAQKAPLGPRERLAQSLSLRGRIAAARLVEQRRGPIGRRVAFHTIRHVIA